MTMMKNENRKEEEEKEKDKQANKTTDTVENFAKKNIHDRS